ncbi:hypothetical protein BGZ76_011539 [Entomortierella beljakovae]|nr:hypothetical protein BGZ76_011539 [Entomortierella beljakovae]
MLVVNINSSDSLPEYDDLQQQQQRKIESSSSSPSPAVLTMVEEGSLQCPLRRWRQNRIRLGSNVVDSQMSPVCAKCPRCSTPKTSAAITMGARRAVTSAQQQQQQQYHPHGVMYGPTLTSIRRAWKVLKREPSSPTGYSPLTMNKSESESEDEGEILFKSSPTVLEMNPPAFSESSSLLYEQDKEDHEEDDEVDEDTPCMSGPCTCICDDVTIAIDENISSRRVRSSIIPRPKSILMASLAVWTILMAFSSVLGFSHVIPALSVPSEVQPAPAQYNNNNNNNNDANMGGIDLQAWEPMSSNNNNNKVRQGGFVSFEGGPESIVMSEGADTSNDDFLNVITDMVSEGLADLGFDVEPTLPLVQADEDVPLIEELMMMEGDEEQPFATIRTGVVIVNRKRDQVEDPGYQSEDEDVSVIEQDIEEFLEPESLDALIMDPEDANLFQDFLAQLEAEDQAAKELQESDMEAQRKKKQDIIKATDDLVITSMLDNDLPCGSGSKSSNLPPIGLMSIAYKIQDVIDSFVGSGRLESHQSGSVFEYLPGWSEIMILLITMCLGSILVGLAQAKILLRQLQEQSMESQKKCSTSIAMILSCVALTGSALGITLFMIFSECWDVPSAYFVGFGIAGMILVHAWVPDSLRVEYMDDDEYLIVDDEESICGIDQEKSI